MNPLYIALSGLILFGLIFFFGRPYIYSQKTGPNFESNYFGPLLKYQKTSSDENLQTLKTAGMAYWKHKGFSQKEAKELIKKDLAKILK